LPQFASALKAEMARIARREMRAEIAALKKAAARQRAEMAALKRRVIEVEQRLVRSDRSRIGDAPPATPERTVRFSATGLEKLRQRLDLSAETLGSILGVSGQTIHNWERATNRPPPEQIAKIAILRSMSKRDVHLRLRDQGR